jgi:mercuric ion transport protein
MKRKIGIVLQEWNSRRVGAIATLRTVHLNPPIMTTQHTSKCPSTVRSVSVSKQGLKTIFLAGIWLFIASLLLQLFTVGMAVFINSSWWTNHVQFSHVIGVLGFILLLISLFGRFPREIWGLTGLLNILFFVQGSSANLALIFPALSLGAAFHPVNALLLFWTATTIARRSRNVLASNNT